MTRERLVALIKASEGKPLPLQIKRGDAVLTIDNLQDDMPILQAIFAI